MGETKEMRMTDKKTGWNCDYERCERTVEDGRLDRVNPKGVKGVFMCGPHANEVNAFEKRSHGATVMTNPEPFVAPERCDVPGCVFAPHHDGHHIDMDQNHLVVTS